MNLLFGFNGRIGRGAYWLGILIMIIVSFVGVGLAFWLYYGGFEEFAKIFEGMQGLDNNDPQAMQQYMQEIQPQLQVAQLVVLVGSLPGTYMAFAIFVKRLHDKGYTGWMSAFMLLPLVNFIMLLWLGFARGQDGPNEYGPSLRAA
ncbi:MAG: DUF805 domain-containing protein [Alphaproteobacteria bacterium]